MSRPPIRDGAVAVSAGRIVSVRPWAEMSNVECHPVVDLGEAVLLPGLINAHCHLDYTDMVGKIPPPRSFPEWIKGIVALKAGWGYSDYALSWLHGAEMLVQTGTTTVANVEAVPELLPEVWHATPLRVISFRELLAVKSHWRAVALVELATSELSKISGAQGRVGLSPHAPYTTNSDMLRRAATVARERRWPLTTHVAESEEEFDMFMQAKGPLYDWLKGQRDMSDCGLGSPVRHLERCGYLGDNLLAAHVNCLARGDAALLAKHGVHVVHCPRSHDYFGRDRFPRRTLAAAGVNLCLGTDSLASVRALRGHSPRLDLFAEMRNYAGRFAGVASAEILRMVTVNAARALGRVGELGELTPGALADLIAIPFSGRISRVFEAVVHYEGDVLASMVNGRWAIAPQASTQ